MKLSKLRIENFRSFKDETTHRLKLYGQTVRNISEKEWMFDKSRYVCLYYQTKFAKNNPP